MGVQAPWGSPPTPLLPRWFRETLSSVPVPEVLRTAKNTVATVGDLVRFWEARSTPLDKAERRTLVKLVGQCRPPPDYVVLPLGVDHADFIQYPLAPRTTNGLRRAGLLEGNDAITVGELLSIDHFGIASLLDLMCVVETKYLTPSTDGALENPSVTDPSDGNPRAVAWSSVVGLIETLLSAASEFRGANTLADALSTDLMQLASTLRLTQAFEAISIRDLTNGRRLTDDLEVRITSIDEGASPAELLILERRLFTSTPQTLEEVGRQLDVTRERVRQIQKRLTRTIDRETGPAMDVVAELVRQQLGPVVSEAAIDQRTTEIFPNTELAARMLKTLLGYSCEKGTCLDTGATEVVDIVQHAGRSLADEVGLIDESALQQQLPTEEWLPHWPALVERCALHRVGGHLALRDTAKARVKAALLSLGEPATREKIAKLCGMEPDRVGAQLSVIPGVARADKTRWGLSAWIDDEYDGIPAEIVQRINEDGGATTLDRLLEELPHLFDVSETSVRTYVGTPHFLLRDGYVSVADESSITLRDLNDVIDGRDSSGAPYWTLVVEDRYFDGYSAVGFPPELARELGCAPNGSTRARIAHPSGCSELSVVWRLSSPTGPSLGYLSEPLRRLAVVGGDRVRVVIRGRGVVELHRDDTEADQSNGGPDRLADSLLERLKNRREVL